MEKLKQQTPKHKVLFTGGLMLDNHFASFQEKGYEVITKSPTDLVDPVKLIEALKGVEVYIQAGEDKITSQVIKAATDLKIISFFGAGYELYVDVDAATDSGVAVTYTPGANAVAVAEFTLGLILNLSRQISYFNEQTRQGKWPEIPCWNLRGRTLGVIGMGNVGTRVAEIARMGFKMRVIYHSRSRKRQLETDLGIEWADSLEELLHQSDVVTLHVPYGVETTGMIGDKQLKLMKESSVLINVARPQLVDPHALRNALAQKLIAGVAMDGYYVSPVPTPEKEEYGLTMFSSDRLLIMPHAAYLTEDSTATMIDMVLNDIEAFFENREIPYLINPNYIDNRR